MYAILLTLHSLIRWLVLISLVIASVYTYKSWKSGKVYTKKDDALRHWTATFAHIQMTIGLVLYFQSPLTAYFRSNFAEAIHNRELRFFGMEHSLMMLIAVVLVSIGSSLSKRKQDDREKFKTMAVWFTISLVIILLNIPWQFSPLVSRPYYRVF
jgi:predicted transporter